MALAIKFEGLIRQGVFRDYADLARLGCVSQGRITQIINLLHLVPHIQEQLLDFSKLTPGCTRIVERHVRPLALKTDWSERKLWREIVCSVDRFRSGRTP